MFVLCAALISIAVVTTIDYLNFRHTLKSQTLAWMSEIANARRNHIISLTKQLRQQTIDFSKDGFIQKYVGLIGRGEFLRQEYVTALNRYLSEDKKSVNPYIVAIAVTDAAGTVIASTSKNVLDVNVFGEDAFSRAADNGYVGRPQYCPQLNAKGIPVSAPIFSAQSGEKLGVVATVYDLDALDSITAQRTGLRETGEVYVVGEDKKMITSSRFIEDAPLNVVVDTEPVRLAVEHGKGMVGVYPDYRNIPVVGASSYIPEYEWTLLSEIDEAEAFAPLKWLGIASGIVGGVCAAIVSSIAILFAVSVSRPMRQLVDATKRIAGGELEYRVKIARKDEIGVLANSFNNMAFALAEEIKEMKQLMEFSNYAGATVGEDTLIRHMVRVLKERFQPDVVAVLLLDVEKNVLDIRAIDPPMSENEFVKDEVILNPFLCNVVRTGQKFACKDIDRDIPCGGLLYNIREGGYLCLPMMAGGNVLGTAVMIKKQKGYWDDEELHELILTYIGLTSSALQRIRLIETTKNAAVTDTLTGLYNRRFFDEALIKQIALAKRRGESIGLLLIDLDHFKNFNDTYGHLAGDRALQQLSRILKNSTRASDIICRYGGEEFVVIMPATNMDNSTEKAERIRQHVESSQLDAVVPTQSSRMTISIGVASFPEYGADYDTLVGAADRALYRAKEGGRNRVERA